MKKRVEQQRQVNPTKPENYCKIARSGGSRYLAVSKFIPQDWQMVYVTSNKIGDGHIMLSVKRVNVGG